MAKPFTPNDPPKLWDFAGRCTPDTTFELRLVGRPTAKAIGHVIRFLEITQGFIAEDEAVRAVVPDQGIADSFAPTPPKGSDHE
jgi:hypothetical protein